MTDEPNELSELVDKVLEETLSVGGKEYIFKIEPTCRVCRDSSILKTVNTLLANGMTYNAIERTLKPINDAMESPSDRVGRNSIRSHRLNHFPRDEAAAGLYRDILERRAIEQGIDFVEGVGSVVTPMAALDVIVSKGFADIQSRRAEPVSADTMIRAAKELQAMTDRLEDSSQIDQMRGEFNRVLDAVKKVVPYDMWQAIVEEVSSQKHEDEIKEIGQ